jgi:hypothetical protein
VKFGWVVMGRSVHIGIKKALSHLSAILLLLMVGCASNPVPLVESGSGKTVCDSYLVMSMCVQDVVGDGTVDIVYFSDTREVFMYQEGRKSMMSDFMVFHRCAVPLNTGMQATTNRILDRENMKLSEELKITRTLISNYSQSKAEIDACNAEFDGGMQADRAPEDDFLFDDGGWEDG